jgi:hypothetical protein
LFPFAGSGEAWRFPDPDPPNQELDDDEDEDEDEDDDDENGFFPNLEPEAAPATAFIAVSNI